MWDPNDYRREISVENDFNYANEQMPMQSVPFEGRAYNLFENEPKVPFNSPRHEKVEGQKQTIKKVETAKLDRLFNVGIVMALVGTGMAFTGSVRINPFLCEIGTIVAIAGVVLCLIALVRRMRNSSSRQDRILPNENRSHVANQIGSDKSSEIEEDYRRNDSSNGDFFSQGSVNVPFSQGYNNDRFVQDGGDRFAQKNDTFNHGENGNFFEEIDSSDYLRYENRFNKENEFAVHDDSSTQIANFLPEGEFDSEDSLPSSKTSDEREFESSSGDPAEKFVSVEEEERIPAAVVPNSNPKIGSLRNLSPAHGITTEILRNKTLKRTPSKADRQSDGPSTQEDFKKDLRSPSTVDLKPKDQRVFDLQNLRDAFQIALDDIDRHASSGAFLKREAENKRDQIKTGLCKMLNLDPATTADAVLQTRIAEEIKTSVK